VAAGEGQQNQLAMAAVDEQLLQKVQSLSDLALAALLCLVNREHCLICTEPDALDDLVHELQCIGSRTFGLRSAVVRCTPQTTLDDFAAALLLPGSSTPDTAVERSPAISPAHGATRHESYVSPQANSSGGETPGSLGQQGSLEIANIILAPNLDQASKAVQIQALELLRTRRILTRTAMQTAPKHFMFVAVLGAASGGAARVTQHLNDMLFLSHWHDPEEDGYEFFDSDNDEGGGGDASEGHRSQGRSRVDVGERLGDEVSVTSTESIVKTRRATSSLEKRLTIITESDIKRLHQLTSEVQVDIDVLRYQMNIVSFLRMHRAVAWHRLCDTYTGGHGSAQDLHAPHRHRRTGEGAQHAVGQRVAGDSHIVGWGGTRRRC
jgi:hypothetical protein